MCKVRSEGGDGSSYEPPEMQWMVGGGYPFDKVNSYKKVNLSVLNYSVGYLYFLFTIDYFFNSSLLILTTERGGRMGEHI